MHTRHILSIVSVASLALTAAALPVSATVVVNGGFETTDGGDGANAANWAGENGSTILRTATGGVGGTAGMLISNVTSASAAGPVMQFTAVEGGRAITPGLEYNLEFDSNRTFQAGGVFQALVDYRDAGNAPLGGGTNQTLVNPTSGYEHSTFSLGIAPAGATQALVQFFAITGAETGSSSSVVLDNVKVSAVPDPASLSLLALSGLTLIRRRRA
jgi:hypothetical protein